MSGHSPEPSDDESETKAALESQLEDGEPPSKRWKPSTRNRDGHIRTRVSRACDRCKARKTRCTGNFPCYHCCHVGLPCSFNATYRRGRLPSVELAHDRQESSHTHSLNSASSEEPLVEPVPSSAGTEPPSSAHWSTPSHGFPSRHHHVSVPRGGEYIADRSTYMGQHDQEPLNASLHPPDTASRHPSERVPGRSLRNSPEPAQVDQQGLYVGPASGASFLLRIQRKLQKQSPSSSEASIFTFGDLPLPGSDSSVVILPSRPEAEELLARYFDFSSATHRFCHRPTVNQWLDELCETKGAMRDKSTARGRKAVLFMIFAHAINYPKVITGPIVPDASADYFHAAEDQLAGEKGVIRLTSVQARLSQCFYLLAHSRLNHCWTLFGTTAHLALALGIHRRRHTETGGKHHHIDYVEAECRKRTFWCLYNLDTYLSAALGRPRSFHDDDIDQELPSRVDDNFLQVRHIEAPSSGTQSIMTGCIAHIRLSRIVANILKDFYGISSRSTEKQLDLAATYTADLSAWRDTMAHLLDTAHTLDPSYLLPIFLRQRNVLSLAYWHANILLYRPFLLNSFASLTNYSVNDRVRRSARAADIARHVRGCLDAALQIVRLVDTLHTAGQLYSTFWFTNYFAFCAVVVLYVHAIQSRDLSSTTTSAAAATDNSGDAFQTGNNSQNLQLASRCQWQISSQARPGSLPERYGVVLSELRLEVVRHNPGLRSLFPDLADATSSPLAQSGYPRHHHAGYPQQQEHVRAMGGEASGVPMVATGDASHGVHHHHQQHLDDIGGGGGGEQGIGFQDLSPSSSIAQMTGWPRFDSLVSGGAGGWEDLLSEDPIEGWGLTGGM